jgi:hypothetical protein
MRRLTEARAFLVITSQTWFPDTRNGGHRDRLRRRHGGRVHPDPGPRMPLRHVPHDGGHPGRAPRAMAVKLGCASGSRTRRPARTMTSPSPSSAEAIRYDAVSITLRQCACMMHRWRNTGNLESPETAEAWVKDDLGSSLGARPPLPPGVDPAKTPPKPESLGGSADESSESSDF